MNNKIILAACLSGAFAPAMAATSAQCDGLPRLDAVSYTHLTLPTIYSV